MDTRDVADYTLANGGGTFASWNGSIETVEPPRDADSAWLVAVDPRGDYQNTKRTLANANDIDTLQAALWEFLSTWHHNGRYFGTWLDFREDGDVVLYIDHVIFTSRKEAEKIGRERNELAIYNPVTKELVEL